MITPELSEAMLAAVAPEIIDAARQAQQSSSVGPMPDQLQQMLQGQPGAPAPGAPAPGAPAPAEAPQEAPLPVEQQAEELPPTQLAEPTTSQAEVPQQ
jgi:hypothetical protein